MDDKKCWISEKDGSTVVYVNPKAVIEPLNGKLLPEDIKNGSDMVNKVTQLTSLNNSLYRQCNETGCAESCKLPFRSIPNGNMKTKIMLLNKMPSQYETYMMCSHCDTASIFLSLILSRINMTRNDVYCTDVIKCNCENLDEHSFRACVNSYLIKEIQYIQPKLVICNGIAVLKTLDKLGYIGGLPQDASYGNVYDVTMGGVPLKITAIFDLEKVLAKEGNDLAECKGKLWIQIINAYRTIGG